MCTLGGYFIYKKNSKINTQLLKDILIHINLRGRDAFGIYNTYIKKKVFSSHNEMYSFVMLNFFNWDNLFLIARAIPATERKETFSLERDTQPFVYKNCISTHNGLISNDKFLRQKYQLKTESNVDSSILPVIFTKFGVVDSLSTLIDGSFAIASLKEDSLYLATNFMPLYYYVEDGIVYWFSDPIVFTKNNLFYQKVPYYYCLSFNKNSESENIYFIGNRNDLDKKKVAVICSGGLDSVTTLFLYKYLGYDVSLIHFKYGQQAEEVEDFITTKISKEYNIPKFTFDVKDFFQKYTVPSVLLNNKKIDFNRLYDAESTYSYVGCRNAFFTLMTMSFCEKMKIGNIALGLNLDDSVYPDNNITYLREFTELSKVSMDVNHFVNIEAPFVHLTKKEIIEIALSINAPLHLNVSCYYPKLVNGEVVACGKCGCDMLRVESFKSLGIKDPIKYAIEQDWKIFEVPKKKIDDYLNYLYIPSLNIINKEN